MTLCNPAHYHNRSCVVQSWVEGVMDGNRKVDANQKSTQNKLNPSSLAKRVVGTVTGHQTTMVATATVSSPKSCRNMVSLAKTLEDGNCALDNSYSTLETADLSGSFSDFSLNKTVRFGGSIVHTYPKQVVDKVKPQSPKAIRKQAHRWHGIGDELLGDIHAIPVRDRIRRMLELNSRVEEGRGLEKDMCRAFMEHTRAKRRRAVQAVLEQQWWELEEGDPETALAKASMKLSHDARCMARVLGLADQRIVQLENKNQSSRDVVKAKATTDVVQDSDTEDEMDVSIRSTDSQRAHGVDPVGFARRLGRNVSKKVSRQGVYPFSLQGKYGTC